MYHVQDGGVGHPLIYEVKIIKLSEHLVWWQSTCMQSVAVNISSFLSTLVRGCSALILVRTLVHKFREHRLHTMVLTWGKKDSFISMFYPTGYANS